VAPMDVPRRRRSDRGASNHHTGSHPVESSHTHGRRRRSADESSRRRGRSHNGHSQEEHGNGSVGRSGSERQHRNPDESSSSRRRPHRAHRSRSRQSGESPQEEASANSLDPIVASMSSTPADGLHPIIASMSSPADGLHPIIASVSTPKNGVEVAPQRAASRRNSGSHVHWLDGSGSARPDLAMLSQPRRSFSEGMVVSAVAGVTQDGPFQSEVGRRSASLEAVTGLVQGAGSFLRRARQQAIGKSAAAKGGDMAATCFPPAGGPSAAWRESTMATGKPPLPAEAADDDQPSGIIGSEDRLRAPIDGDALMQARWPVSDLKGGGKRGSAVMTAAGGVAAPRAGGSSRLLAEQQHSSSRRKHSDGKHLDRERPRAVEIGRDRKHSDRKHSGRKYSDRIPTGGAASGKSHQPTRHHHHHHHHRRDHRHAHSHQAGGQAVRL